LLKDYGNWCPEIYRSIFIDRHNDNCVRIAPCCQAATRIESVNNFDFNTSPYLTELRQQFNNNEKPSACNQCWQTEKVGHKSRRQSAIEFFELSAPDHTVVLESFDHSATWACNLACIMCKPLYSSTWANELNYNKQKLEEIGRQFQKSNNFLDNFDVSQIKKIHFNGGEPMLNNDQTQLLEKLEEQDVLKNTFISYNTNGTVMPTNKIIDLWKKAQLVKIFFSIDAVNSAFGYIRYPGNWEKTSRNILDMKEHLPGNVMFGFNTTVGNYNLLEIADVYQWFTNNLLTNRFNDASDFNWQLAGNFNIADLNQATKQIAIEQLDKIPQLQGIVNHIKSTINYNRNDEWISKLDEIDQRRKTNWRAVLKVAKYY
jgi:molybdenum cofactor biosynthesis enzyme MoaA